MSSLLSTPKSHNGGRTRQVSQAADTKGTGIHG